MIKRIDKISSLTWWILWRMIWVSVPLTFLGGISIWAFLALSLNTDAPTLMEFFYTPITHIPKYLSVGMPLPLFKIVSYFSWIVLTMLLVRFTITYPYRVLGHGEKALLIFNTPYGREKLWWHWLWRLELFTSPLILSDFFYRADIKPLWLTLGENAITFIIAYFILRGFLLKNPKKYGITIKWIPRGSIHRH